MKFIKLTKENLTQDILKTLIDYDPFTGVITRKELPETMRVYFKLQYHFDQWNKRAGEVMTFESPDNRKGRNYTTVKICIKSMYFTASRLIWLYMSGDWPKNHVDHIDGDSTNNRWDNLRDVTCSENHRNQKIRKNNNSGKTGVNWNQKMKKWHARGSITKDGVQTRVELGCYEDLQDAIDARVAWEKSQGNFTPRHMKVVIEDKVEVQPKKSDRAAKLTDEDVQYIRNNYVPYSKTNGRAVLCERFGISTEQLRRIVNGHSPKTIGKD